MATLKWVSSGCSVVSRSCGGPGHQVLTTCSCVRLCRWRGSLSSSLPCSPLPWIQLSCIMPSDARRRNQLVVKLCRVNTSSPYRYWHSFQSFEPGKKTKKKSPKYLRLKSGAATRANYDETNPSTVASLIISGLPHVECSANVLFLFFWFKALLRKWNSLVWRS